MAALHKTTAGQWAQNFHLINLSAIHEMICAVCANRNRWLEWQESKIPRATADKLIPVTSL